MMFGMIAGSTIGYVASSENAQKFLFGENTEEGGDNRTALGIVKDKLKERLPGMTAGAIGGLIAGPFGVAGNLILGAGIGYVATGDRSMKRRIKLCFADMMQMIKDLLENLEQRLSILLKKCFIIQVMH